MGQWQDRVGQRIGEYQLVRRLNSGTFGTVYFAQQVGTGNVAAVKVLHLHLTGRDEFFDASCKSNCQPLWSFLTGGYIQVSSPAVANGLVYVGSYDGKFYAFDANCKSNCQPLWSFQTGDVIFSSPAVANGLVYVGSGDGNLYAFGFPS